MRLSIPLLAACSITLVHAASQAADVQAGRAKVEAVCAACHGANGVSVSDTIPNLAGQRVAYIESQLRAFKDGSRKNPVMSAIAGQLSTPEIVNVAAYFNSLPPGGGATKSSFLPNLVTSKLAFPEDYQTRYTHYLTINFPETRQVRRYFASPAAMAAAKAGKELPDGSAMIAEVHSVKLGEDGKPMQGADGFFVADKLLFYTAMGREAGWGAEIPEMLRNSNWNYAAFTVAKQSRPVNQAECLACHKPLDQASYTFTIDKLVAKARSER